MLYTGDRGWRGGEESDFNSKGLSLISPIFHVPVLTIYLKIFKIRLGCFKIF